jgi:hypothetical protein
MEDEKLNEDPEDLQEQKPQDKVNESDMQNYLNNKFPEKDIDEKKK